MNSHLQNHETDSESPIRDLKPGLSEISPVEEATASQRQQRKEDAMGTCEKWMCGESTTEKAKHSQFCRPPFDCFGWRMRWSGRLVLGILLIAIGLLWFARVAGLFQVDYFWPVVLIIFGIWVYAREIICGVPMIVGGSLWLGETLKLFQPGYFWPLFVIIIGIWIVVARLIKKAV